MSARRVVLMTAGGTREPIDDVRHISNVASGRLPAAMAEHWLALGATVHYVHGPGAVIPGLLHVTEPLLEGDDDAFELTLHTLVARARERRQRIRAGTLHIYPVQTADETARVVRTLAAQHRPDLAACAMAVADFAPVPVVGKLSSRPGGAMPGAMQLTLHPTAKVIDGVHEACPSTQVLGFKLLSGADEPAHVAAAQTLAQRAGASWVFGNDMADYRRGIRRGVLRDPTGVPLLDLGGTAGLSVSALATALVNAVEARARA